MQDRLARDPVSALGVTPTATAEEVRSAFLELTKRYHPVRFGRMALDIQQLSNEVFLALRGAHDTLARSLRRQTGPIQTARPPVSPAAPPITGRMLPPVPPRGPRAAGASDSGERAPIASHPITPPGGTPSGGTRTVPRTGAPPTTPRPGPALPARPPVAAPTAAPAAPHNESAVLDLLSRQQWDQARTALHQLSARDPGSKRLRALTAYARGRQAQIEGRVDDARVELHDALDLDPDLQLAKTALTELFTRRK